MKTFLIYIIALAPIIFIFVLPISLVFWHTKRKQKKYRDLAQHAETTLAAFTNERQRNDAVSLAFQPPAGAKYLVAGEKRETDTTLGQLLMELNSHNYLKKLSFVIIVLIAAFFWRCFSFLTVI